MAGAEIGLPADVWVVLALVVAIGTEIRWALSRRHLREIQGAFRDLALVGVNDVNGRPTEIAPRRSKTVNGVLTLRFALPPGLTLERIQSTQLALEQTLGHQLAVWIDRKLLNMQLDPIPDLITYEDFYAGESPTSAKLPLGIGQGINGPVWADLAALPHVLVGGHTGGGKSGVICQWLTHLAETVTPETMRWVLIDMKGGVELRQFGVLPHMWNPIAEDGTEITGSVAENPVSAAAILGCVRKELDRRLALLPIGIKKIDDVPGLAIPRLVVVVDELAELTTKSPGDQRNKKAQEESAMLLNEIGRLGRAAGVHLICCTQRPDAVVFPGQLKANMPATLAFRTMNQINSKILEVEGAEHLPKKPGRALWHTDENVEVQVPYLSDPGSMERLAAVSAAYGRFR